MREGGNKAGQCNKPPSGGRLCKRAEKWYGHQSLHDIVDHDTIKIICACTSHANHTRVGQMRCELSQACVSRRLRGFKLERMKMYLAWLRNVMHVGVQQGCNALQQR